MAERSMQFAIPEVRASRTLARCAPKIVYTLSGGAAKGFCHFGTAAAVYRRVEEVLAPREFASFEKKFLGVMKHAHGDLDSRLRRLLSSMQGTMKNGMHPGRAMVSSAMIARDDAESIFARVFEGITFENLATPFAAVAVNLTGVLFQPVDRVFPWSSFSAWRELVEMGRRSMTDQRLQDLEGAFIAKCAASARMDAHPARRVLARRRLGRISPRSASGRGSGPPLPSG